MVHLVEAIIRHEEFISGMCVFVCCNLWQGVYRCDKQSGFPSVQCSIEQEGTMNVSSHLHKLILTKSLGTLDCILVYSSKLYGRS